MTVRNAAARSWTLYRKNFPVLIAAVVIQLVLRLIVMAPLLFLLHKQTALLALLTPALWLLIVPFSRQRFADALAALQENGRFPLSSLVSLSGWGRKTLSRLKTGGLLLLWGLLFIAATVFAYLAYIGALMDAFSLLRAIMSLGRSGIATALLSSFDSDTLRGIAAVMILYALTLLPLFFGCAFHSWCRHRDALSGSRNMIRHHRGRLILTWLAGWVPAIPFALCAGVICGSYLRSLVSALSNFASGSFALPALDSKLYLLLAAFLVLLVPVLPFRSLMTGVYVNSLREEKN